MSISAVSGNSTATSATFLPGRRPDPSKLAEQAFSKLDVGNKGFLDKTDLTSAFEKIGAANPNASTSTPATQVDEIIKSLDSSGDGKITKQEFSDGLSRVAEQLDQQFNAQRFAASGAFAQQAFQEIDTQGKGFLEQEDLQNALDQVKSSGVSSDKLASAEDLMKALDSNGDKKLSQQEFSDGLQQASQNLAPPAAGGAAGSAAGRPVDSARPAGPPPGGSAPAGKASETSSTSSSKNYDPADANQDGTVSEQELSTYQQSSAYLNSHPAAQSDEQRVAFNILQLAHSYGHAAEGNNAVDTNA